MSCEDVSIELTALAHEEPSDDPDVVTHLERCPECGEHERALAPVREYWKNVRETGDRARARRLGEPPPPDHGRTGSRGAFRASSWPFRRSLRRPPSSSSA
jgi:hypothetical protein